MVRVQCNHCLNIYKRNETTGSCYLCHTDKRAMVGLQRFIVYDIRLMLSCFDFVLGA